VTELITSPHNQIVKLAAALRQKKNRDETGLFMAEGVRLVEEAATSGWLIETCFFTERALSSERTRGLLDNLKAAGCRMIKVMDAIYDKISDTKQPQGIMVLVKKRSSDLAQLLSGPALPLIVVLDGIQDPGNVGTVIRTADATGCTGVVLTKGCADLFSAKTVRASMGSLFHLPVIEGLEYRDIVSFLVKNTINIVATSLDCSSVYFESDFKQPVAIVFGNEGKGVSEEMLDVANSKIHIPIVGRAESLNVAASAAVILYEVVRQRR